MNYNFIPFLFPFYSKPKTSHSHLTPLIHTIPSTATNAMRQSHIGSEENVSSIIPHHKRQFLIAIIFVAISIIRIRNVDFYTTLLSSSFSSSSQNNNNSTSSSTQHNLPLATVAYAISITSCGPKLSQRLFDAAAVLKRSIELNSYPMHNSSRYEPKFYAFTLKPEKGDPKDDNCYKILELAGWTMRPENEPLYIDLIKEPAGSILKMGIGR